MKVKSYFDYLEAFASSHVGSVRTENQDYYGFVKSDYFEAFLVSDGMGGARGGQVAASECVKNLSQTLKTVDHEPTAEELKDIIRTTNLHIHEMAQSEPLLRGMGTTVVGLIVCKSKVLMFAVGDSRIYRLRAGNLYQLTIDHTVWNDLVSSGSLSPQSGFAKEISHMLTKSIGPDKNIEPDITEIQIEPGDTYLLCTDGLYSMISEGQIVETLKSNVLKTAASASKTIDELINLANLGGGQDNITAMIINVAADAEDIFPKTEEVLPGLRLCDLTTSVPATCSATFTGDAANQIGDTTDNTIPSQTLHPDIIHLETECDSEHVLPERNKSKLKALASMMMILAFSALLTVVFGVRGGLKNVKPTCPSKQVDLQKLTNEQVISEFKRRNLDKAYFGNKVRRISG